MGRAINQDNKSPKGRNGHILKVLTEKYSTLRNPQKWIHIALSRTEVCQIRRPQYPIGHMIKTEAQSQTAGCDTYYVTQAKLL